MIQVARLFIISETPLVGPVLLLSQSTNSSGSCVEKVLSLILLFVHSRTKDNNNSLVKRKICLKKQDCSNSRPGWHEKRVTTPLGKISARPHT